jgi:hypothetical protein
MGYADLIGRAWQITAHHRVFWLFGFLLALFGGSSSSRFSPLSLINPSFGAGNIPILTALSVTLLGTLAALGVVWFVGGFIMRPIAATAIISMGQHLEEGGPISATDGWRFGWSRRAWRLFLIELIVRVSSSIIFAVAFAAAFIPLLLLMVDYQPLQLLAGFATLNFFCLWFIFFLISSLFIAPFIEICRRYVILANISALNSLKHGYRLLRYKFKDFLSATLLMLVLNFGWYVASSIVNAIVGGVVLASSMVGLMAGDPASTLAGSLIILGITCFALLALLLWAFATGVFLVFQLTFWTLAFREINLTAY